MNLLKPSKSKKSRYTLLIPLWVIILGVVARFYKIMFHYGKNGVDEGIQLMASRLMHQGYILYDDFNTLQAPLGHWFLSVLEGDIFLSRLLIALLSIIGIAAVIFLVKKEVGLYPASITGLMMTFSTLYLRESRISSLDMMVTSILVLAFVFLTISNDMKGKWGLLAFTLSGVFFGLGIMVKLFAVIPFIAVLTYFALKSLKEIMDKKGISWKNIVKMVMLGFSTICVVTFILFIFDPTLVIEGMFFANLEVRGYQSLTVRLMDIGMFFILNLPILLFSIIGIKELLKEKKWMIPLWFFSLLAWFSLQPITYDHHLLLLIPPLYISGGIGINIFIDYIRNKLKTTNQYKHKKNATLALITVFLLMAVPFFANAGLQILDLEEPIEYIVARKVENVTQEDEFILCGDPIIGIIADRNQVPEMVNVAKTAFPPLNATMIIEYCKNYEVPLIVVTYHLSEIEEFKDYVLENYSFICGYESTGEIITNHTLNWGKENYLVYRKGDLN